MREAEEVLLGGQLRDAVGRDRIRGVILVRREALGVAVDRAPAGREDDLGDTGRERRPRDADRAEDVDLRVEDGILDGLSHVDLRRVMEDRVHVRVVKEAFEVEAADVAFDESGPFREAGPLARREIVEDDDVLAIGEKGVCEMGADETGAAGHEDGTRLGHHAAEDSVPSRRPCPLSFYRRDTAVVARDLLGCRLIRRFPGGERRAVVIVETEAYLGAKDRAAHTWNGRRTPRVAPMWGPGGHAYVYFVYGMHYLPQCRDAAGGRAGGRSAQSGCFGGNGGESGEERAKRKQQQDRGRSRGSLLLLSRSREALRLPRSDGRFVRSFSLRSRSC